MKINLKDSLKSLAKSSESAVKKQKTKQKKYFVALNVFFSFTVSKNTQKHSKAKKVQKTKRLQKGRRESK